MTHPQRTTKIPAPTPRKDAALKEAEKEKAARHPDDIDPVEEALEDSFPASDPPAFGGTTRIGMPPKKKSEKKPQ